MYLIRRLIREAGASHKYPRASREQDPTKERSSEIKTCKEDCRTSLYAEAETIPVTPGRLIVMRAVSRWLVKSYDLRCLSFT